MGLEIYYHEYLLNPLNTLSSKAGAAPRSGALLRVNGGYSTIQPWPEFGDLPLDAQLQALRDRSETPLIRRSLHYATLDQGAREKQISLFQGLSIPKSHTTIIDLEALVSQNPEDGTFKIKVGKDPQQECTLLNRLNTHGRLRLRLDANTSFTRDQATFFWCALSPALRSCVEFFEDPVPCSPTWRELTELGMPLALDNYASTDIGENYSVRILKPLVQDVLTIAEYEYSKGNKLVVTTCMDHPVGQVIASWEAARLLRRYPRNVLTCGLLSHTIYEPNDFSRNLQVENNYLLAPSGTGFGFDELLEGLTWKRLV